MNNEETFYQAMRRQGVTRRSFLKYCSLAATSLGLGAGMAPKIAWALENKPRIPVVWIHGLECTCCTESFIRSAHPLAKDVILSLISLDYDDTLMAAAGTQAEEVFEDIIAQYNGKYILAVEGNPTQATPIDKVITDKPIIKVPGCPPIPDVMSAIITYMVTFDRLPDVDRMGRPLMFYGQRIHDKCYRRAHFDAGEFVQSWDDDAARKGYCLYKMGCKGPTTYNACSSTRWNDGVSFPIQSGHGCLGCAENGFWDRGSFYSRVVDIPQMGTHSTADTVGLTALGVVAAAVGVHAVASAVDQRRRHNQQPTETEHQPGNEDKQA
ncbi:hydrogenase 1 small subunit [Escherichia coli]|uniref:hydrogenase 1 small subunit n=1 Tax=Escherichia coli TaxID=562 RepID=UPI000BDE60B8|nr:hydrogenase 1 small subunit [Escherichia coli]